ncbi:MAG: CPBP family intramembrane glutamic endopeptidase [Bacillota bacterium]
MNKQISFEPKAFPIIYLISVYSMLLISVFLQRAPENTAMSFLSFALPQIIHLLVIGIYSAYKKVDIFAAIPIKVKMPAKKYMWTALIVIGFFCFALLPNVISMTLFNSAGMPASVRVPAMTNIQNILLGLVIICVLPALGEEMLFRGVLVSSFKEYGGVSVILMSALFFSLSHLNLAQTFYQFAIGVVVCYLYLKTGNLIIPIIIHFLNNAIALFLPAAIPFFQNLKLDGMTFLILLAMFVVGLFVFVLAIRKLVGDIKRSSDIVVFEYQAENDEFVAVATEKSKKSVFKSAIATIKREFLYTYQDIVRTFKKGQIKKRIESFKEQFPKTRKLNNLIKIILAVIIGLWFITILL